MHVLSRETELVELLFHRCLIICKQRYFIQQLRSRYIFLTLMRHSRNNDQYYQCHSISTICIILQRAIYIMESGQVHVKRKRRARNDPHQRDFVCPCGKSYLSYPALYTHIKNKHQGQTPASGQITIPRGQRSSIPINRDDAESDNDKHLSSPDDALASVFNTFRGYLTKKDLTYSIEDIYSIFPAQLAGDMREKTKSWDEMKGKPEKMNQNGIKIVAIDMIMAKFTNLLVKKIDCGLLQQLVLVLLIFRKSLNYQYSRQLDKTQPDTPNLNFTRDSLGMRMLEHVNQFVLCYFDIFAKPYRHLIKGPSFIGRPERQYICLTKFMFLFGRWAYLERFTHFKIKINNF